VTNFKKFAETPEALGELLASLTVIDSPWEDAFHKAFCHRRTASPAWCKILCKRNSTKSRRGALKSSQAWG